MYDKGQKAEPADNLKRGQSHVYPYDENNPKGPKRTQTNYAQNLNQASLLKKEDNCTDLFEEIFEEDWNKECQGKS